MLWLPTALLLSQVVWLLCFSFFSFFNYLYGLASLRRPRLTRTVPSGQRVAVVVVSYNERHVLPATISHCFTLSYPNKVIVLSDDSDDPDVVEMLRTLARGYGACRADLSEGGLEIWESKDFVFFHRPTNDGFKGGNLRQISRYLKGKGIELMYLLDADWHAQTDAVERAAEVLEADPQIAFVQAKRITFEPELRLFQKYVTISEEGCYYVDFEGRQVLGQPILFSGCCTLIRLDRVEAVGGFAHGHLTEDLDVTNRLWLAGWKGVYCGDIVNYGEAPFTYDDFRRQQERWSCGTARCLRDYFLPLIRSRRLNWMEKAAAIRQNSYFTTSLITVAAILQGMATVAWLSLGAGTFEADYYLHLVSVWRWPLLAAVYACVFSNFVEPLIMILFKKRQLTDLIHMPVGIWYAWSVLPAHVQGNLKGLLGIKLDWFLTPKYLRNQVGSLSRMPGTARLANIAACTAILAFYAVEGWVFGWRDPFAFLLIPAFILAAIE